MDYRVVAAGMLALIGVGLYLYEPHESPAELPDTKIEKPAPSQAQGFGIIYIEKIQAAHPDGEYLDGLRATELRLRLELNEAMKIVRPKPMRKSSTRRRGRKMLRQSSVSWQNWRAARRRPPSNIAKIPSRVIGRSATESSASSSTKI